MPRTTTRIRQTRERHKGPLTTLSATTSVKGLSDYHYIIVCIDGPESVNREASWSSSFDDKDTHNIFKALAEQTR